MNECWNGPDERISHTFCAGLFGKLKLKFSNETWLLICHFAKRVGTLWPQAQAIQYHIAKTSKKGKLQWHWRQCQLPFLKIGPIVARFSSEFHNLSSKISCVALLSWFWFTFAPVVGVRFFRTSMKSFNYGLWHERRGIRINKCGMNAVWVDKKFPGHSNPYCMCWDTDSFNTSATRHHSRHLSIIICRRHKYCSCVIRKQFIFLYSHWKTDTRCEIFPPHNLHLLMPHIYAGLERKWSRYFWTRHSSLRQRSHLVLSAF